jgi:DNA-binding NarL/FixJ family response regulator
MRVAIADDEEDMRVLLRVVLEGDGRFEVVGEACDGNEAIAVCEALRPDGLLLDLRMPAMTGAEALPLVRQASPDTVVVVFSAYVSDELTEHLVARGATAVLSKTTRMREVADHLARALTDR